MSTRYQIARRAARAAGKVLREKFEHPREIKLKGRRDIVTDADYAADHALRQIIHAQFPNDAFLSEEDSAETREQLWANARAENGIYLWIADPLDGTTNYAHRVPFFSTSLALFHADRVELGAVYDPLRGELFAAARGKGATLNGKPIRVTDTRVFEEGIAATEWARAAAIRRRTADVFKRTVVRAMSGRALGSAALSLCYIAAGRLSTYFHLSLSSWDVAAAALIVEEAGGRVTTPAGDAWTVHSQSYVATNGHLHKQMMRCFK
ncbi:MAG: inositol monophosphatase [Chloroflexi bacterium]|nr:inositol monophosphatase [Chloroflexota bacterium]